MNFRDSGILFAFGFEGYLDGELKNDPKFVKNLVRMFGKKDDEDYETLIPFHRCTEDDFEEFAPPVDEAASMLESIKTSEKRGLFCLDWDAIS